MDKFTHYWSFMRETIGYRWIAIKKSQTCEALVFYLALAWTDCWTTTVAIWDAMTLVWRHFNGYMMMIGTQKPLDYIIAFSWILWDHDDVIKWKHFPCYWSFVRRIHRSQRPVTLSFDVFFDMGLNKRLGRQSRHQWFETPSHSLWRHGNAAVRSDDTYVRQSIGFHCPGNGLSSETPSHSLWRHRNDAFVVPWISKRKPQPYMYICT